MTRKSKKFAIFDAFLNHSVFFFLLIFFLFYEIEIIGEIHAQHLFKKFFSLRIGCLRIIKFYNQYTTHMHQHKMFFLANMLYILSLNINHFKFFSFGLAYLLIDSHWWSWKCFFLKQFFIASFCYTFTENVCHWSTQLSISVGKRIWPTDVSRPLIN